MKMKEYHQLRSQKDLYFPNWEIKHLFIGTFNPKSGEDVNYFYGRPRNNTWKILGAIFKEELDPNSSDFLEKLKKHGIACMDMIHSVEITAEQKPAVIGKGYSDTAIIRGSVLREYNTESILQVIGSNKDIRVYSTWGKGQNLKEWRTEISKIQGVIPLVSPSNAARVPKGTNKWEYMLSNWSNSIKQ